MTPLEALDRAIYYLDRADPEPRRGSSFKLRAFLHAREVLAALDPAEVEVRSDDGTLSELPGIGAATARLVAGALAGDDPPAYLAELDAQTKVPITPAGEVYRAALRGDCHVHSRWSDGSAPIATMARAAAALGHEYIVLTDHSARLTVAHGLDRHRLEEQLVEVATLNDELAPFRVLTGMEVDILDDGSLDLAEDLLARLDVVVASVHSKLRMERARMTERMVLAVAGEHVDILGHCTGRMPPKRPPSDFDADYVFAACARFGTAVEINCRPERLDPPQELLDLALGYDCFVAIDTDAHAPGQLEWQPYGCDKAALSEVPLERVINTWPAEELLAWVRA